MCNELETVNILIDELNQKTRSFIQYSVDDATKMYKLYNHNKVLTDYMDIDDMELYLNLIIRWEESK